MRSCTCPAVDILAALHHRHEVALQGAYAMIAAQAAAIEALAAEVRRLRSRDELRGYCTEILE